MSFVFGVAAVSLGIFFLWGLLAPRSQWRALWAWSVSDQHASEPGGAAYGWWRLLSALGVIGMLVVAGIGSAPGVLSALPQTPRVVSPVQLMWGSPEPELVDRVVSPLTTAPEGLVSVPVLGYQDLDLDDLPPYLLELNHFTRLGVDDIPGEIGSEPGKGFSAIGPADLVVNVRGSVLCIPREAVVIETETAVQIAIYYGLPDPAPVVDADGEIIAGPAPDHVAGCPADDPLTGSVLIPIVLAAVLGDREVQQLDGSSVRKVRLAD